MSEIDQLAAALVAAQEQMVSPRRNRSVEVKLKSGGKYLFKYTTLDAINDMIREPLAKNGLCLVHQLSLEPKSVLITRLIHTSGQSIETAMPVPINTNDMQEMGSSLSYARRYGIVALLNISSDEDDDGAAASQRQSTPQPGPSLADRFRRFISLARETHKPEQIVDLLKAWQRDMDAFEALRRDPTRQEQWGLIVTDVQAAISRAMGDSFGGAWGAGLVAQTQADIAKMKKFWDGEWSQGINFAKKAWPQAYALLAEHMRAQAARVAALGEPEDQGGEQGAEVIQSLNNEANAKPTAFFHYLVDEFGEVVSEAYSDPVAFAGALADLANVTDSIENLAEHNGVAIQKCRAVPEAAALLAVLPATQITAIVPKEGRNGLDLTTYLKEVKAAIAALNATNFQPWIDCNEPTYRTLPQGSKLQIMKALAERKVALGL